MKLLGRKKPPIEDKTESYSIKDGFGWIKGICVIMTIIPTVGMTWILFTAPVPEALFWQSVEITTWALVQCVLIMLFLVKTPALPYLVGSFSKRMILVHPRENRYLEHVLCKVYGGLARVKKRGYYKLDPKHVYVEGKSKVPTALVYGNFGLNLDIKAADAVQKLKAAGINDADELMATLAKLRENNQGMEVQLLGESVNAAELADYFNRSERSDLTESEIQRRQASTIMSKLKQPGEMLKWMIGAGVLIFIVAIAFNVVMMAYPAPTAAAAPAATPNYVTQAVAAINPPVETPPLSVT